ncbi:MAG: dTDP-glucose 4,6-dehydratase [Parcubacteria group bacterium]|nr:dTDP-glucose 4,6-dehydratase [Parcubacteria group bacterium]
MKLLITGGAGFIGSNFIHYILEKYPNYKIVNLDLLTYAGNLENLRSIADNLNYQFIRGDVCDAPLVDELVSDTDAIVHFAAESHVDRSIENPTDFVRTNVLGTQILLDAALKHNKKRFHHVSTDEVYGQLGPNDAPFNEGTVYNPRSPYSASKAASDYLVRAYFYTHKLPITISNCSNNYGPLQFPEKVVPLFVTNLIEGKKVPLYGDGSNIRDWLHVKDHCEAIDLVLHRGRIGETYCIGGGQELSNLELTKRILSSMGRGEEMIECVSDRKGHDWRYAIDHSKIREEFGWDPKYSFDSGLAETINWYKNNESWWKKLK